MRQLNQELGKCFCELEEIGSTRTLKQTSHWKGFTEEWMWVCCLSPEEVANVFPHSGQAWERAPT